MIYISLETVKHIEESVLDVGSSIPSLQFDGGALLSYSMGKAGLSSIFLWKQSRDVVDCPVSCHCRVQSLILPPLGPVRFLGCFPSLILTVEFIC